ncbi:MAG TPA: ABC transporter ATP-binding protein [bacterium]
MSKTYRRADGPALDGMSLSIGRGSFFGLLGPNGAGKTTLLSILCTLIRPDSGTVSIDGHPLSERPSAIKATLGYVPQDIALYPTLSARENLAFFGAMQGLRAPALAKEIERCLDIADLHDLADRRVRTLSGGQKRRLSLAVGLIHNPRLLLLDEPTVGIDPPSRHFLYDSLKRMNAEGMTVLYASHYLEEVEYLCQEIAILDRGRLIATGPVRELLARFGHDVIAIRTAAPVPDAVVREAGGLPSVREARWRDGALTLISASPARTTRNALALLEERGIGVLSLRQGTASLEELFLSLTQGRSGTGGHPPWHG